MRKGISFAILGLAGLFSGCDSPGRSVSVNTVSPPHQGTMIPLPGDGGYVELVNEPEVSDRRKPEPTALVAYFFQIDGKSALVPAPEDVNFAILSPGARGDRNNQKPGERIRLSSEPKADDPQGAARFASKPGAYALEGRRGTLTAKIGGQEISCTFAGSR